MTIFHSYVSLPEGIQTLPTKKMDAASVKRAASSADRLEARGLQGLQRTGGSSQEEPRGVDVVFISGDK